MHAPNAEFAQKLEGLKELLGIDAAQQFQQLLGVGRVKLVVEARLYGGGDGCENGHRKVALVGFQSVQHRTMQILSSCSMCTTGGT
jgi:hypothetical protein